MQRDKGNGSSARAAQAPQTKQVSKQDVLKRLEKLDQEAAGWKADLVTSFRGGYYKTTFDTYKRSSCLLALQQLDDRRKALEDELGGAGIVQRLGQMDKEAAAWKASWLTFTDTGHIAEGDAGPTCWVHREKVDARRQALENRLIQKQAPRDSKPPFVWW